MANIVVLDGHTMNPGDLSWEPLEALGNLKVYDQTPSGQVPDRAKGAEILLTNKVILNEKIFEELPKLRFISVMATGYNVVDVEAAKERGIVVSNVRGYAANSVAQHVFALLLEMTNQAAAHSRDVAAGGWQKSPYWSYNLQTTWELAGKTMGIYGFGQIGQKVADIALAFGMKVISNHKHPERDRRTGVTFVSFEKMMTESDVVTLHAPLTTENQGIVNSQTLGLMKRSAYLVNTGRGGLVMEADLKMALETGVIAGAGLDVLSVEPPAGGNILTGVKNCLITPHNAWATRESRARLLAESAENVKAFLEGNPRNEIGK
jgi:glycerate dehydrogenase